MSRGHFRSRTPRDARAPCEVGGGGEAEILDTPSCALEEKPTERRSLIDPSNLRDPIHPSQAPRKRPRRRKLRPRHCRLSGDVMARLDAIRAEQTVQDLALQLDEAAGPMVAFVGDDEYASLEDVIADFEEVAAGNAGDAEERPAEQGR